MSSFRNYYPTYSLPMGMGIMRVGIVAQDLIHCHMCIQGIITGQKDYCISRQPLYIIRPLAYTMVTEFTY